MTWTEIAAELGVSITRVRQIEKSAMIKLRYEIENNFPEMKSYLKDLIYPKGQWEHF